MTNHDHGDQIGSLPNYFILKIERVLGEFIINFKLLKVVIVISHCLKRKAHQSLLIPLNNVYLHLHC